MLKIAFWMKESGNLLGVRTGLNLEQIEALKSLKEGDRFILWKQEQKTETSPFYVLKLFTPKERPADAIREDTMPSI